MALGNKKEPEQKYLLREAIKLVKEAIDEEQAFIEDSLSKAYLILQN